MSKHSELVSAIKKLREDFSDQEFVITANKFDTSGKVRIEVPVSVYREIVRGTK